MGLLSADPSKRGPRPSYSAVGVSELDRPSDGGEPLLERLRQRFLAFARRSLASDVAEDLVQETFLLLTTKYAHVRAPEDRVRLGIAIIRKKRAGHWRKSHRRGEAEAVDATEANLEDDRPDPEELADGDCSSLVCGRPWRRSRAAAASSCVSSSKNGRFRRSPRS